MIMTPGSLFLASLRFVRRENGNKIRMKPISTLVRPTIHSIPEDRNKFAVVEESSKRPGSDEFEVMP